MFLFVPAPSKSLTEKGKKQQEYSSNVRGGLPEGKEVDVYNYERALKESNTTHEESRKYWNDVSNSDPYSRLGKQVDAAIDIQAPKVEIKDGGITISAPQKVLDSALVKQIDEQLQTLKGADLNSAEVVNAIDALNKDIQDNMRNWMVEAEFGWTPEEFADYRRAIQIVNVTNPMSSKETLKAKRPGGGGGFYVYPEGHEKEGQVMELTPQEWIDYWREIFSTDQRYDMFKASLESDDPYERVMALIMSKGDENPVYGFDPGERIAQGLSAFHENAQLFPKGVTRTIGTNDDTRRLESLIKDTGLDWQFALQASDYMSWDAEDGTILSDWTKDEDSFNKMKEDISGKSWDELSDLQKLFVLEVGVSKETSSTRYNERGLIGDDRQYAKDLKNANSDDKDVSKEAIKNILSNNSYDDVKKINSDFLRWQAWDEETVNKPMQKLIDNSTWAANEIRIGTMAGTIFRFLWENMVGEALTGHSMNRISDAIAGSATEGTGVLGWLARHNISPVSPSGASALKFVVTLAATIPEDLVQTAVDNIVTYNEDENANLFNPDEMSDNFKSNLVFISLFNAARAGWSSIKKAKLMKQMAQAADLDTPIDIGLAGSDATDIAKAYEDGGHVETDGESVYKVNADGTREKLENTTPEQANIIRNTMESETVDIPQEKPYAGGMDTEFYSFIEKASPIEGVRESQGSLTKWLSSSDIVDYDGTRSVSHPDMSLKDGTTLDRINSLPQEIQDAIKNDQNIQALINRYGYSTAFQRLGQDFPASQTILDGSYANYVWKQLSSGGATGKVAGAGDAADATLNTPDFDDAAKAAKDASSVVDDAGKAASDGAVKVDVDTPDGRVETEAQDYRFRSDAPEDVLDSKIKVEATKSGLNKWYNGALNALMRNAQTNLFREFRARFGNEITTADFDTVFHYGEQGLTPEQMIGKEIKGTNRVVTQNTIDALKWWAEQPINKIMRESSRASLGESGDYNRLGYLPHTSYDPWALPFEEGKAGQLWQHYTGKSMVDSDGNFVGYGGTIEGRFRTFLSNMLWDIKNKEVQAARLVEEAALDGKKIAPDEAMKMVEGWEQIEDNVKNPKKSKSMDNLVKGTLADGDSGKADFEAANEAFRQEAPNSGITKAMNKNFSEMYIGSGRGNVEQPKNSGEFIYAVGDQGQTMRNIKVNGVSMYDAGAADIVYAPQNAKEFVRRWMRENKAPSEFRSYLADYLRVHSQRSPKYIEPVVDRIIARIAKENPNGVTKGGLIKTLTKAFRSEGYNRLRRWTVLADYSQFSKSTTRFMDSFWYRHMQLDGLTSNKNIIAKIAGALSDLVTEARYDALFYGNFKNALLQTSELNRLYTEFKWGDVGTMLRKMATDADFREKVDMYVEAVAPETGYVRAGLYEDYGNAADSMKVKETETVFGKMRNAKDTVDHIALAPIEAAESLKNRTMVAALVAEADRLEAAGKINGANEKLMYIRRRFERVALAQNEMGKIGLSTNPVAKPFLFLQNFQIRELGMNWYNIVDPDDLLEGTKLKKGKVWNAIKYITKVFGAKLGTTLILSRLGYSAAQTMGLDPLGLMDRYDRLDDEEKTWIDEQISGGLLTPLFSGGIMSLFADMYFMAREAYEDSNRVTMEDEAGANLNKGFAGGLDISGLGGGNMLDILSGFIPGNVAANRIGQMNEMLDTGWATSATGNKMYTAPDDALNTVFGYLFGRSATQNAQDYRQSYGDDLYQTLGRILRGVTGQGTTFDPIDTVNYTDWFDGSENDLQQFEKGKRWFIDERDRILDEYQTALQNDKKYGDVYEADAKASMVKRLDDLSEKLERFVNAYEKEHGSISGKMVKELIGVLNFERESVNDTTDQTNERGTLEYSKAKERYAQLGLPDVGYYSGPSKDYPGTSIDESKIEVKYKGSPQWQVSSTSKYTLQSELAAVLRAGDAVLEDYRKELKDLYSEAVQSNDYTEFNKAQTEYLKAFDNVVGPIVATYGVGTLNDDEVKAQLEKMLSTSSNSGKNIGNLVPYKQYATDKYGRVRSMPNESINVVKWAMERYNSDIFKRPTIRSYSTAQDDIDAIKRMAANGENDLAWARALSLKVRIDNQKRSLSKEDYQWLLDFLNNGGK